MKKKLTLILVIVLAVLIIAGVAVWFFAFHNSERIGGAAAKQAALADAGFTEGEVRALKSDYENDDGFKYYEVTFICGTTEYEYAIDAFTGEVLHSETEPVFD